MEKEIYVYIWEWDLTICINPSAEPESAQAVYIVSEYSQSDLKLFAC